LFQFISIILNGEKYLHKGEPLRGRDEFCVAQLRYRASMALGVINQRQNRMMPPWLAMATESGTFMIITTSTELDRSTNDGAMPAEPKLPKDIKSPHKPAAWTAIK
jgi:hypothetical protein